MAGMKSFPAMWLYPTRDDVTGTGWAGAKFSMAKYNARKQREVGNQPTAGAGMLGGMLRSLLGGTKTSPSPAAQGQVSPVAAVADDSTTQGSGPNWDQVTALELAKAQQLGAIGNINPNLWTQAHDTATRGTPQHAFRNYGETMQGAMSGMAAMNQANANRVSANRQTAMDYDLARRKLDIMERQPRRQALTELGNPALSVLANMGEPTDPGERERFRQQSASLRNKMFRSLLQPAETSVQRKFRMAMARNRPPVPQQADLISKLLARWAS